MFPNYSGLSRGHISQRIQDTVYQELFQTALHKLRSELSNRNAMIVLGGVGVVLGLSGPFQTISLLSTGPRIAYWLFVAATTYSLGCFLSFFCSGLMRRQPIWVHIVVNSLVIGTAVTLTIETLNSVVYGPASGGETPSWAVLVLISGVIEAGMHLTRPKKPDITPPLLDRISAAKRGPLIALSSEDHYVKITTTNGVDLTLMRLSDAMKEVGGTEGMQIHRSHWVAFEHVVDIKRDKASNLAVLSNGETRPISRSYMTAVREAGLEPKERAHG
jgi:hypothetical protein